jgi:hypothetical protein
MQLDFWNNPVLVSALRVKYRRGGFFNTTTLYLLLLIAGGMVLHYYKARIETPWPKVYLLSLLGLQFVVSGLIAGAATSSSMRSEVVNHTLDFQRLTALTPRTILLGKLLGEPALAYHLALVTVPLAVWCTLLGVVGVTFPVLILVYVNLATSIILTGSLGLLQRIEGTATKPGSGNTAGAVWVVLLFVLSPGLIANAAAIFATPWSGAVVGLVVPAAVFYGIAQGDPWNFCLSFFGAPVPFLLVTPLTQILLAGLCFRIMERRLVTPLNTSLTKANAYLILVVGDVLAASVFFDPPSRGGPPLERRCAGFWLVHLLISLLLCFSVTPWRESLQSWVWRLRDRTSSLRSAWLGERSANTLVLVTFGAIGLATFWLLVVLPARTAEGWTVVQNALPMLIASSVLCTVVLLALGTADQWFIAVAGRNGRAAFFTFAVVLIVPLHLLGYWYQVPLLMALTPSAHFASWFRSEPLPALAPAVLLYGVLFFLLWFSMRRRVAHYGHVVDQKLMEMGVRKAAG